jgi:hypothetical protein
MVNSTLSLTIESEIADMIANDANKEEIPISQLLRKIIKEKYKDRILISEGIQNE